MRGHTVQNTQVREPAAAKHYSQVQPFLPVKGHA